MKLIACDNADRAQPARCMAWHGMVWHVQVLEMTEAPLEQMIGAAIDWCRSEARLLTPG